MNDATLRRHVERPLESLRREFAGQFPASLVTAMGKAHYDRLRANARISDFIPVLVYRNVREDLKQIGREELHRAA